MFKFVVARIISNCILSFLISRIYAGSFRGLQRTNLSLPSLMGSCALWVVLIWEVHYQIGNLFPKKSQSNP